MLQQEEAITTQATQYSVIEGIKQVSHSDIAAVAHLEKALEKEMPLEQQFSREMILRQDAPDTRIPDSTTIRQMGQVQLQSQHVGMPTH